MTSRDRFLNTINFKPVKDRLPMIEWAPWWDKTIARWKSEGVPQHLDYEETLDFFGLDRVSWPGVIQLVIDVVELYQLGEFDGGCFFCGALLRRLR